MKRVLRIAVICGLLMGWLALAVPYVRADWRSLSGLLPEHAGSLWYTISPDSKYVAYITEADTDEVNELYIVPLAGGAPLKLNPPLIPNGDVERGWAYFTLDSKYVIYRADQEVDNRVELYSVPVTGGQATKLNQALVAGGNVGGFVLDPDGQRLVYLADADTNDVFELWSISVSGGGLFKLNAPFTSGGDVGIFQIDPLSNRVVYSADQETDGKYELFSVPILGGSPVKLNPPIMLAGGGDSGIYSDFAVNPIVPVVVFIAREAGSLGGSVYMIPTAGGVTPQKLSFNLPANDRIIGFRISPAGDRVVFNVATSNDVANRGYAFVGNLYSTLIGGGGNANLTETAEPYYGVGFFQFTPDGTRIVYQYQKNATTKKRLESSTVQGGVRATVYEPSGSDAPLYTYRVSPDSDWVLYTTGADYASRELYTVPVAGGSPVRFGPGNDPLVTPDSERVVFARITGSDNRSDLFSAQIFGGDQRDLSGMDGTGYVGDVKISPDGKWVVYAAQLENRYDLRVSDGRAAQLPTTPTEPSPSPSPGIPTPTPSGSPQPALNRLLLPMAQR